MLRGHAVYAVYAVPAFLVLLVLVLVLPAAVSSFLLQHNHGRHGRHDGPGRLTVTRAVTLPLSCTSTLLAANAQSSSDEIASDESSSATVVVDVAIVGAGLGGLCAGAILNSVYGRRVAIFESHYLAGGCAHAFDRQDATTGTTFTFDSGPTIVLGCSRAENPNALQQVLQAVNQTVTWLPYDGWGMLEHPQTDQQREWKVTVGGDSFQKGPLLQFGGAEAVEEYRQLQELTKPLIAGVEIPAMAMRSGPSALIPLLRKLDVLFKLIAAGEATTGTFGPYMDGPVYHVKSPWLRSWLDALAFSLSGLPANRTAAAAMAFTLYDMHTANATLDYPVGGMGAIVDALVRGVEQGSKGSKLHLRQTVQQIDFDKDGATAVGVTLQNGQKVRATQGVISNVPVWSFRGLVDHHAAALDRLGPLAATAPSVSWKMTTQGSALMDRSPEQNSPDALLAACDQAEQTGSFMHLHLAIDATGLDLEPLHAHYTVMDRGLMGTGATDGPCGEANMIAVSNPCKLDATLAPPGTIIIHAYGAGNEAYQYWKGLDRRSEEYKQLKEERSQVLWRAVESIIPDVRSRVLLDLTGSPLTHERFLRRPAGTYGSATEDYLKDGSTPIQRLVLAGDGIFPGIGVVRKPQTSKPQLSHPSSLTLAYALLLPIFAACCGNQWSQCSQQLGEVSRKHWEGTGPWCFCEPIQSSQHCFLGMVVSGNTGNA